MQIYLWFMEASGCWGFQMVDPEPSKNFILGSTLYSAFNWYRSIKLMHMYKPWVKIPHSRARWSTGILYRQWYCKIINYISQMGRSLNVDVTCHTSYYTNILSRATSHGAPWLRWREDIQTEGSVIVVTWMTGQWERTASLGMWQRLHTSFTIKHT